jgi:hypothetical protein
MKKTLAISFGAFLISFVIQYLLIYLFPYTGLSRLLAIPFCIFLSAIVAAVYYYGVKFYSTFQDHPNLYGLLTLVLVIFLNIQLYVQEFRPSIWSQIYSYSKVYLNYDTIKYDDLFIPRDRQDYMRTPGELPKYVAALHKFRNKIPYDGSYSIYLVRETPVSDPSDYDPVLYSSEEIYSKLDTGAEKQFYRILGWSKE